MGDHAPLFDTRFEQQVEHGFIKFYGKQCSACCHDGGIAAGAWYLLVIVEKMSHLIS